LGSKFKKKRLSIITKEENKNMTDLSDDYREKKVLVKWWGGHENGRREKTAKERTRRLTMDHRSETQGVRQSMSIPTARQMSYDRKRIL